MKTLKTGWSKVIEVNTAITLRGSRHTGTCLPKSWPGRRLQGCVYGGNESRHTLKMCALSMDCISAHTKWGKEVWRAPKGRKEIQMFCGYKTHPGSPQKGSSQSHLRGRVTSLVIRGCALGRHQFPHQIVPCAGPQGGVTSTWEGARPAAAPKIQSGSIWRCGAPASSTCGGQWGDRDDAMSTVPMRTLNWRQLQQSWRVNYGGDILRDAVWQLQSMHVQW